MGSNESYPELGRDSILSIEYARTLLGSESDKLSDSEILALIDHLDALAKLLIDMYKVQKSTQDVKL